MNDLGIQILNCLLDGPSETTWFTEKQIRLD